MFIVTLKMQNNAKMIEISKIALNGQKSQKWANIFLQNEQNIVISRKKLPTNSSQHEVT